MLDLGCGDGELLEILVRQRGVRAEGIDIDERSIHRCVARGLSVLHKDIDEGLPEYGDKSFDWVLLLQSLHQVPHLERVLGDALRIGRRVIIGFPNFAHYQARVQVFFGGRTPVTPSLPHKWYDTPNLHLLSILEFKDYCRERGIRIEASAYFSNGRRVKRLPNVLALVGLFQISAGREDGPRPAMGPGTELPDRT